MKRAGWLILLISLGLNLGLGYRLLQGDRGPGLPPPEQFEPDREMGPGPGPDRPGRLGRGGEPDSTRWQRMMEGRLNRIAERLQLTPDQVEDFRATQERSTAGMAAQRRQVAAARLHLHQVIARGDAPADEVRQAIREVGRQQAAMDSLITETILLEMESLDPDQRALYLETLPGLPGASSGLRSGRGGHHRKR